MTWTPANRWRRCWWSPHTLYPNCFRVLEGEERIPGWVAQGMESLPAVLFGYDPWMSYRKLYPLMEALVARCWIGSGVSLERVAQLLRRTPALLEQILVLAELPRPMQYEARTLREVASLATPGLRDIAQCTDTGQKWRMWDAWAEQAEPAAWRRIKKGRRCLSEGSIPASVRAFDPSCRVELTDMV